MHNLKIVRSFVTATTLLLFGTSGRAWDGLEQTDPGTATLRVNLTLAVKSNAGEVGCALFREAKGFPLDDSRAMTLWQPAGPDLTCVFERLTHGTYAVAVAHDLNGNRKTDRNFLGMPKEAWGVSNNARPSLRAPRFQEAVVQLSENLTIAIEVRK